MADDEQKGSEDAGPEAPAKTAPGAKKKISLKEAWPHARELLWARRFRMLLGLALLVPNRLASLVLPSSTKVIFDDVIGERQVELLPWLAGAILAATVIQSLSGFGLSMVLGVAAQRSINDLRRKVQRHIGRLPVSYFDEHKSGELISRIMSDAEGIRNLVGTGFVQLIGGLLTAVVAVGVLVWLNWRLTLIIVVVLVVFAGVMGVGFKRLRPIFRERNEINARTTGRLAEALGGIRVVKAYTAERREARSFAANTHQLLRNVVKSMIGIALVTNGTGLLVGLSGTVMAWVGANEVLAGRMTVGDIVMYVFFSGMAVMPMVQISAIGTQITEAFAGLDRIREVLSEPTERDGDRRRRRLGRLAGEVRLEDVSFEYKPGVPVLRGVTFTAPAGTTTALVGPSGSGKSTLISLVMAFNRPTRGTVSVDGENLADVRLDDFRSQLGIVLQDNFLFDGTVLENIVYSRPGATREEVEAAAAIAHCDEFIDGFEDGYETVIGERGVKVSGGQRQRLAIARAILADPRILILDEATSSLDSESEEKIQDGLRALLRGRTTFVIAHRLSTIVNADQILVLDGGEVVERGSHEELLAAGGRYRSLYDKQYKLERNRFINPGEEPLSEASPVERPKLVPAGPRSAL